jgi:hypothetical protein
MTPAEATSNPFALMMEPEAVLAAVARSELLARLHSRIWRPLDKPTAARPATAAAVAFDELVDGADEPAA